MTKKAGVSTFGEYGTTGTYVVNDVCINEGILYRCKTNTPSPAGAFNTTYWETTTIADELKRIESKEADSALIANIYNTTPGTTYAVGDYVIYEDELYRCTNVVSDTSVWNSQFWDKVKLADEVSDLKSAFGNNYDGLINIKEYFVRLPNSNVTFHSKNYYAAYVGLFHNIVTLNWTIGAGATNNRVALTGTPSTISTAAPNYNTRPEWFVDDIPDFIVGHKYLFDIKLLSGEIKNDGYVKNFLVFTKDGTLNNKLINIGATWTCNIKPQSVSLNLAPGTYKDCVWYVYIIDKTLEDSAFDEIKNRVIAPENFERLSNISIKNAEIGEVKNAITTLSFNKLSVDLPFTPSNLNTPSLINIVDYTAYDSVAVYLGKQYGTATKTESISLSNVYQILYGGSVDFATGLITKTYDDIIADGSSNNLKFTVSGTTYRLNNTKLSNCINNYRCFSSWLPGLVLRTNKQNHFIYGYASDFANLGFASVDDLNAQLQLTPLHIFFELSTPIEASIQSRTIYPIDKDIVVWSNIGTLNIAYPAIYQESTETAVDAYRTNTYALNNSISLAPTYKIPNRLYHEATPYFHDIVGNENTTDSYARTNGICYDGERYMYYVLGRDTVYGIRKFDTWTKRVVKTGEFAENGHFETLTFVPSWCPGFDNGTIDRIYETTLSTDSDIKVFDASNLELLTSFSTKTLINSEYYKGISRITFNKERGKFVFLGARVTIGGVNYHTVGIANLNGEIEKCIRCKDLGTTCGLDSDENYIYYLKDLDESEDIMVILDWNLNPINMARCYFPDWEQEGMCHIGDVFYFISNILTNRGMNGGINIRKYHCVNLYLPLSQNFPLNGWNNSYINLDSFGNIII